MEAGGEGRLRSTLGVFGTAFRNRSLLLVELAWLAFNSAEWGVWLALTVWAYVHGGAPVSSRRRAPGSSRSGTPRSPTWMPG